MSNLKIEKPPLLEEISKKENIPKDLLSNLSSQRILNNNIINKDIEINQLKDNINKNKNNNDNLLVSRNLKYQK